MLAEKGEESVDDGACNAIEDPNDDAYDDDADNDDPRLFQGICPGGPGDLFQFRLQLPEEPPHALEKAGLFVLVGLGLGLFRLGGFGLFRLLLRTSWFIFSFSDIQFHPSFLQGMWAIIT